MCPAGMLMRGGVCRKPYMITKGHGKIKQQLLKYKITKYLFAVGLLGNRCETNDDCSIAHSECNNHECECAEGYRIFGSTQCILKPPEPKGMKRIIDEVTQPSPVSNVWEVPVGAACNATRICSEGSICTRNVCECPKGTRLFKNYCRSAPIGMQIL